MKTKKLSIIFPVVLILLSFVVAFYFYPIMPSQIATHWGVSGQADGYSSKAFGLFFMPVLSVFLFFLFISLPKIDPYKKNFDQFKNYFQNFINLIFSFFFYIYLITIIWNLGFRFNMIQILSPAFALLFYYAGVLMLHAKQNWFVGIRTPWTLSSENVWQKTHYLGAKLFKLTAIISLLSIIWPLSATFFIMVPVILSSLFLFLYSYVIFRQEKH